MPGLSVSKPLALLIPGLDGTGRLFYRQIDPLAEAYRVRPYEFGTRAEFTLEDLTRELGQATAGEPDHSILVVGESFGGLIAIDYAVNYPERMRQLVLVNAFPYYHRRLRIRLARALARLLERRAARRIKNYIVDRILRREGILLQDRERYKDIIRRIDRPAYLRRLQLVQELDLRPRLREINVPCILLAGGRDKIVPSVREARFMASRIPGARVHEFPGAGHALLLTPEVTLADYVPKRISGTNKTVNRDADS